MAWTITPTMDQQGAIKHHLYGDYVYVLKLACTSDSSSGSLSLKTDGAGATSTNYPRIMERLADSTLYLVISDPGSGGDAPSAAYTVTIADKNSITIFSKEMSHTADTITAGSETCAVLPTIFDQITIGITTLGDANTTTLYFYFWK